jgi:DNA-binding transcriptional LysR family regulator
MADLNHVALFAQVVEAGSFSGAARNLGIPKATVSRKVARLESDLGARLLHRTTRKLELTTLGQRYYEEVRTGLSKLLSAEEQASSTQAVPSGTLRVAAPVEIGAQQLVDAMPEFLSRYPGIDLELVLDDGIVDLIAERIDVAFRTGRLGSSSYMVKKLGSTRRVLVASSSYLARRGTPKRVQDLKDHDCIVFGRSLEDATWKLDGPSGSSELRVRGRIAIDSARAALRAAEAGLGIALLPFALVRTEIEAGSLRQLLPRYGVEGGGLYILYPSKRHPSAALRAFIDFFEPKMRKS